ncbi:lysophospholipase [Lasiosphaeria miniovina]|uniref:Lysophospholipase n=1 Tax=Lasiosphaeria miniovina TaxID=1954250 RepID=A0AA40BFZ8_9PEZI|nr:lysophospholipase [Lasiosphaeria miniovina]KAK0733542.1 lysophospholipase [Lasiosphaeria miniovina]
MHLLRVTLLQALLLLVAFACAEPIRRIPADAAAAVAVARAAPDSPSGKYAPKVVPCPAVRPRIRPAGGVSPNETAWLQLRRRATVQPMIDFMQRVGIPNFDAAGYIRSAAAAPGIPNLPNVAIAASGGGYRALMNGAGFLAAADNRTTDALAKGGIGGLLQSTTYLAGLSGGGWLVSSIYANNFSSVETLRNGRKDSSIWKFGNSIFIGPKESGIDIFNTAEYWTAVARQVDQKDEAGFNTSLTDYWGRALSYQLVDAPDGGPAYTWSSIAEDESFKRGLVPFPILVADARAPGETIISLNATVFEFNAFEMGSFDPTTFGFTPVNYLASNFSGGVVPANGKCVEGFDQVGYVMGTSSTLFNQFLLNNISSVASVPKFVVDAIEKILEDLSDDRNDIAQYAPNPFLGWKPDTNPSADAAELDLVDGGEDLQNIPLHPLIQPFRKVDVIFAVDSSADTIYNWPNGTAMRASYERSLGPLANGTLFPPVPDDKTFVNLGLNNKPTFFGCDVRNFTLRGSQSAPPLIVYIPNAPYTASSNVSTFTPSYTDEVRNNIIRNGLNAATQGNGTLDANWPTCVACAVLSRSLTRSATPVPAACADCFAKYCWTGKLDPVDRGRPYEPPYKIANETASALSGAGRAVFTDRAALLSLAVGLVALLLAV